MEFQVSTKIFFVFFTFSKISQLFNDKEKKIKIQQISWSFLLKPSLLLLPLSEYWIYQLIGYHLMGDKFITSYQLAVGYRR